MRSDTLPQGRKELKLVRTGRGTVQGSGDTETFHSKHDWKWRMHRHFYDVVKQSDSLTFCLFSMQTNVLQVKNSA